MSNSKLSQKIMDELLSLEGEEEYYQILYDLEDMLEGNVKSTEAGNIVLAVYGLEREVGNGGFKQFFYNSSVEFTPIIVDALTKIDSPKMALLAQRAIDCLNVDPNDIEKVEAIALEENEKLSNCLGELDKTFYEYEEEEFLDKKLFEYVKKNREKFILA